MNKMKKKFAFSLKRHKVNQKHRIFRLGLIILISALLTFILVRQVSLWRLRFQLTAETPFLSIYDPVRLKDQLKKGDQELLLVDLRPKKEFRSGHIKTAVNIPWQNDLSAWLKQLKQHETKGKTIILYEYSQASALPQELALYLKKDRQDAYYLAIGYNEWRHFYTFWLPESQWGAWQPEQFSDLPE